MGWFTSLFKQGLKAETKVAAKVGTELAEEGAEAATKQAAKAAGKEALSHQEKYYQKLLWKESLLGKGTKLAQKVAIGTAATGAAAWGIAEGYDGVKDYISEKLGLNKDKVDIIIGDDGKVVLKKTDDDGKVTFEKTNKTKAEWEAEQAAAEANKPKGIIDTFLDPIKSAISGVTDWVGEHGILATIIGGVAALVGGSSLFGKLGNLFGGGEEGGSFLGGLASNIIPLALVAAGGFILYKVATGSSHDEHEQQLAKGKDGAELGKSKELAGNTPEVSQQQTVAPDAKATSKVNVPGAAAIAADANNAAAPEVVGDIATAKVNGIDPSILSSVKGMKVENADASKLTGVINTDDSKVEKLAAQTEKTARVSKENTASLN